MKYIVYENTMTGAQHGIIFGTELEHIEVGRMIKGDCPIIQLVSAGFCVISDNLDPDALSCYKISAYGESVSLNLKSREEEDSKILSRMSSFT